MTRATESVGRKERYRVNLINRSKALQDIVEYADKITMQQFGWEEKRRVAWDIYRIVATQPTVEIIERSETE